MARFVTALVKAPAAPICEISGATALELRAICNIKSIDFSIKGINASPRRSGAIRSRRSKIIQPDIPKFLDIIKNGEAGLAAKPFIEMRELAPLPKSRRFSAIKKNKLKFRSDEEEKKCQQKSGREAYA